MDTSRRPGSRPLGHPFRHVEIERAGAYLLTLHAMFAGLLLKPRAATARQITASLGFPYRECTVDAFSPPWCETCPGCIALPVRRIKRGQNVSFGQGLPRSA
jgi:hypothetical protein